MNLQALRKLHSFTGLVPLSVYHGFHAWEHWPVREGRDAALHRLALTSSAPIEVIFLLLPLLVHAGIGLRLAREPDESRAYHSPAFRKLQGLTGLVTALFLLWHVGLVWVPRVMQGGAASAAYAAMQDQAGPVLGMALYVFGLSAVCIHFGQGLAAARIRHAPDAAPRFVRAAAALLALAVWLVMLNVLSVYATGAALL